MALKGKEFKTVDTPFLALVNGQVDAVLFEDSFIKALPEIILSKVFILKQPMTTEFVSAAFRMDDLKLRQKFNDFLEQWKKTDKKSIYQYKYFKAHTDQ